MEEKLLLWVVRVFVIVPLKQVWALSQRWYHNRLSLDFHGRTLAEVEDIFQRTGLLSPFWYMIWE